MNEWISVKDRTPEAFCKVLAVWRSNGETVIDTAFWTDSGFACIHWIVAPAKITHWMPLPEPPEVRE